MNFPRLRKRNFGEKSSTKNPAFETLSSGLPGKMDEKFFSRLQAGVILGVATILVILLWRHYTAPVPTSSMYAVARAGLHHKLLPSRIAQMSGPTTLRLDRVDNRTTNVVGWIVITNKSGLSSTQWFRTTITTHSDSQPEITQIDLFPAEPQTPK